MKTIWGIFAAVLFFVTFSSSCTRMDAPEAAARINFMEWAWNIRTPYRNEKFETINNDGTLSTVRITVDLKIKGEWIEKQVEIQCDKVENNWQCDRFVQLK